MNIYDFSVENINGGSVIKCTEVFDDRKRH